MGDDSSGEIVLFASDVQHLFHVKDYKQLEALIDEHGEDIVVKQLHMRQYSMKPCYTILGYAMIEHDVHMFEYILRTCGCIVLWYAASGDGGSLFCLMDREMRNAYSKQITRSLEIMIEIALDLFGFRVYNSFYKMLSLRYLAENFRYSHATQTLTITTAVWSLRTIRSAAGGATDGLEEVLGERMQAESAWEYEPKIKRTKY
jgi:hypothetical protein